VELAVELAMELAMELAVTVTKNPASGFVSRPGTAFTNFTIFLIKESC
jgi:hypothetical protein